MLFVYGSRMPLRLLEEIREWKTQEKEHMDVIQKAVPRLEPAYLALLRSWRTVFEKTEQRAGAWLEAAVAAQARNAAPTFGDLRSGTDALLQAAALQSQTFALQLMQIVGGSAVLKADGAARSVVLHALRESTYYLGKMEAIEHARNQGVDPHTDPAAEKGGIPTAGLPGIGDGSGILAYEHNLDLIGVEERESRKPVPIGGHTLPPLPYPYNALEPYIDEATMRIHHDKHHQSYVDGLNKAEKELQQARQSGDFSLVRHWECELAFNGAGHYLHTLFWNVMSPQGGGRPVDELADEIDRSFGSYEAFKKQFSEAAAKVQGGGWSILVWSPRSQRLEVLTAEKHQNLSQWDIVPVLPLDVWEHAYYLKHQNKRADYIKDWWNVVNWPYVNERFHKAKTLVWD
ncbi:Fe-Mn family superoxide dismutase [Paenibacillus beijingensis]|uniref:superoxide dismutase n=1 Tax=Paenibacillus beijingensis TaxID=1126833 RepID=A0A0D5NHL1_9BACL|nr:Fe-Mn family superoxide dismutase [Paenibacillus beijingensis]AJY74408.1 superoxide dismutase [Paenibacillus beijingensis]